MPKQNINSIRTYIKVSIIHHQTAKPMHVPGYVLLSEYYVAIAITAFAKLQCNESWAFVSSVALKRPLMPQA